MSPETRQLEADTEARDAALDVGRSFIVQAPAGSGKTELLIQRYLCLLATVAEPEEVVAITFTNKAANEMQARVVRALEAARDSESAPEAHRRRTLDAAARILERDAERGWRLLEMPRRMRIQTLDAYCASITRLLPVSSRLGGALATSADPAMDRLYRDAAAATLDWLTEPGEAADAVGRVLVHLDNHVGDYVTYLARLLAKRDQWLKLIGSGRSDDLAAVRAALERDIALQVAAALRDLRREMAAVGGPGEVDLLRHAGQQLEAAGGDAHPLAALPQADWPGAAADDVAAWRAIADLLTTQAGALRKTVDKRTGFPPGDAGEKAAFVAWLKQLAEVDGLEERLAAARALPDARYRDEQWEVLVALFRVLPGAAAELRRLFAERGVTDHSEIAQAAGDALGSVEEPGELALLLDYRIRHLLVDEMQDTSIGQYRLLAQLTAGWEAGDGRTLFCVGDPMQSIYRFRDAEVGQFVAARAHGIGDVALEPLLLRRNFRSGAKLVDWFNAVFPEVLAEEDDVTSGAVAYAPSVSVEQHAGRGSVELHALVDAAAAEEAECSADVIERCLATDDGSVAVLVRSRTQLPKLLAVLRARGIPCRAIEIDRLTDLPEIIDLLALTRALSHEGDRLAWLALLRSPLVGLTWTDLHALVVNDALATVRELLADPARLAGLTATARERLASFEELLEAHGHAHGARSLRERVECLWLALGGAAALSGTAELDNAYRFLEVLESLEQAGSLPDVAMLESMLDAERVSTPGDAATRVQVLTMHKAKGLEFDHVVLHGLGRHPRPPDRDVLAWLAVAHDDGSSGLLLSPPGPRADRDLDPLHRFIERASAEADAQELGRLLYVACTRAVRSLHLVGSVASRKDGSELGTPVATSLLRRLWSQVAPEFETALARRTHAAAAADDDKAFVVPRLERLDAAAIQLPPPPPSAARAAAAGDREVDFAWVGSAARHAGTIVHRWLQQMADGRRPPDAVPDELAVVSRRWARSLGVADEDLDDVVSRVQRALAGITGDATGRWLLSGDGHAELRLSGLRDDRIVGIVIDRVRIDGNVHWLVDYKTGSHEGGDLAGFLAQEADRYREQLRRYRDVYAATTDATLKTALYFPLLGEFLEVDVDAAS